MFAQVQLRALTGCSRHWRSYLVQRSPQGRCLVGTFLRVWLSCSIQLSFKPDQSHCPSCWKNPQQFWFPPDMRRTLCLHLRRMEVFPYKKKKAWICEAGAMVDLLEAHRFSRPQRSTFPQLPWLHYLTPHGMIWRFFWGRNRGHVGAFAVSHYFRKPKPSI